jgi:NADH-quinone oxidoreductase subunit K
VIVIAAAEVGLGLAIVLLVFRNRATISVDSLRELADRDDAEPAGPPPAAAAEPVPEPEPIR